MAEKIDYPSCVGKTYKTKSETGLNSDRTFTIKEFIAAQDYGTSGAIKGKKPSFRLSRNRGGVHIEPCDKFLAAHDEVKEEAEKTESV